MSQLCPACHRILYNRRLVRCGFCDAPIPEALRFTPAEVAVLAQRTAEVEKAFFERAKAREEDARRQADQAAAVAPLFFMM